MSRYALAVLLGLPLVLLGQSLDRQSQVQSNNFWGPCLTRCGETGPDVLAVGQ